MSWRASEIIRTRWCSRLPDWEPQTSTNSSRASAARMARRTLTSEPSPVEVAPNQSKATATGSSHHLAGMPTVPIDTTRMASWWSQALVWTQINQEISKSRSRNICSSLCSYNQRRLRFPKARCRSSHKSCSTIKKENQCYLPQNLKLPLVNIRKTKQ